VYPNYDKCILNLLSSILKVYDFDSDYRTLPAVDIDSCKQVDNLILLVIDGLGAHYTEKKLPYLKSKTIDSVTTVFPATTASAILSYYTGLAPNQHASTGWFTNLPKQGMVATILPFHQRGYHKSLLAQGIEVTDVFPAEGYIFEKIQGVKRYVITPANLRGNPVSDLTVRAADTRYYRNTGQMLYNLRELIKNKEKKFIFNYFSEFDAVCHKFGVKSPEAFNCIKSFSDKLKVLEDELVATNSRMLICSDHGFLDTTQDKVVYLHCHPELKRCLHLPVAGDSRVKNCFIKSGFEKKFLNYIEANLKDVCRVLSRDEILEMKLYGPHANNPDFVERIGDYILIMDGEHVFHDYVPGEDFEHFNNGNHSGMSEDEMLVPVIQLGV